MGVYLLSAGNIRVWDRWQPSNRIYHSDMSEALIGGGLAAETPTDCWNEGAGVPGWRCIPLLLIGPGEHFCPFIFAYNGGLSTWTPTDHNLWHVQSFVKLFKLENTSHTLGESSHKVFLHPDSDTETASRCFRWESAPSCSLDALG